MTLLGIANIDWDQGGLSQVDTFKINKTQCRNEVKHEIKRDL